MMPEQIWRIQQMALRCDRRAERLSIEGSAHDIYEADELAADANALRVLLTRRKQLGDLLAAIHRDGGQYQIEHGMTKAWSAAMEIVSRLLVDATDQYAKARYDEIRDERNRLQTVIDGHRQWLAETWGDEGEGMPYFYMALADLDRRLGKDGTR